MKNLTLRLATPLDIKRIFEWRNALETRQHSLDPSPLNYSDHIKWFEESLKNPNRYIVIAELAKQPIGVLRYDFFGSQAEISIFINPILKGKGFGTKILLAGTDRVKEQFPKIKSLRAKILPNNIASIRAFEKAGFTMQLLFYEKNL